MTEQPSKLRWVWLVWALVLAVVFAIVETIALRGKRRPLDTLSQSIQWVVRKDRSPWVRWGSLAGWAAFALWFGHHIWVA